MKTQMDNFFENLGRDDITSIVKRLEKEGSNKNSGEANTPQMDDYQEE